MRRKMMMAMGGCVVVGAFALAQPGGTGGGAEPAREQPAREGAIPAEATAVERLILERLARIERGVFREGSILVRSADDSIEQRLERLMAEVRAGDRGGLDGDDARLRDLDREFRAFEMDVARTLERPLGALTRRVVEVEREVDRMEMDRGGEREIESLRRSIGRLERQIASIERRIR